MNREPSERYDGVVPDPAVKASSMTTVSAPYFDQRTRPGMPWTVNIQTGDVVRQFRFATKAEGEAFYDTHATIESVVFRDQQGKDHRWKHARVTRKGKYLVVRRMTRNGEPHPGKGQNEYLVVPQFLARQ